MDLITELVLKFGWLGWKGDFSDLSGLLDWLYKNYGIDLVENTRIKNSYILRFENKILCQYFNIYSENRIIKVIFPDILKLWVCKDGELSGPSLDNYESPNTEWT